MSQQEEKLKFIDGEIVLKEKALSDLNTELNQLHGALEKARNDYNIELEKVSGAFMKKMSEYDQQLNKPEQSLEFVYTDLQNKKDELDKFRNELTKWADSLIIKEREVYNIESDLEGLKSTATILWNKLFINILSDIKTNKSMIDQRSKLLELRIERVQKEETSLKDKIASFRAVQNEFLTKRIQ